jgi:hypothetical protein
MAVLGRGAEKKSAPRGEPTAHILISSETKRRADMQPSALGLSDAYKDLDYVRGVTRG